MAGKNILICCRESGNFNSSKANYSERPRSGNNSPVNCCQRVSEQQTAKASRPLAVGFDGHFSTGSYFLWFINTLEIKPIYIMLLTNQLASANLLQLVLSNYSIMMPLTYSEKNKELIILKIGGNEDVRRHLANLGLTVGGTLTVINSLCGNVIVKVKESRIALNEDLARKIMV